MPRLANPRTKYRSHSTISPLNAASRGNRLFSMSFWRGLLGTRSLPTTGASSGSEQAGTVLVAKSRSARFDSPPPEDVRCPDSARKVLQWLDGTTSQACDFKNARAQSPVMPGAFPVDEPSFIMATGSGYESNGTIKSYWQGSESASESEGRTPSIDLYWGSRSESEARVQALALERDDDWETETERESGSESSGANANESGSDTSREGTPVRKGKLPELSASGSFDTLVVLDALLGPNAPAGGIARYEHYRAKLRNLDRDATPTEVNSEASSDGEYVGYHV